ncbi:hypothetical protein LTS18_005827 [Coniosporium uncinatum]|uniref:Uncharacterized protein n=1 Tax=Coniosporium uncinatum TaxID=93489 RepID=A0ACC3DZ17_9PEZI|nr:hypothetical protein LTS18_005827 [Coniosporium uncinatum]
MTSYNASLRRADRHWLTPDQILERREEALYFRSWQLNDNLQNMPCSVYDLIACMITSSSIASSRSGAGVNAEAALAWANRYCDVQSKRNMLEDLRREGMKRVFIFMDKHHARAEKLEEFERAVELVRQSILVHKPDSALYKCQGYTYQKLVFAAVEAKENPEEASYWK